MYADETEVFEMNRSELVRARAVELVDEATVLATLWWENRMRESSRGCRV